MWTVCVNDGSERSGETIVASDDPRKAAETARELSCKGQGVVLESPEGEEFTYHVLRKQFVAIDSGVEVPRELLGLEGTLPGPDGGPFVA